MAREQILNTPTPLSPSTAWTTLSAGIDDVQTSLTVVSAAAFAGAVGFEFRIMIEAEILLVTGGIGTTTWTVTRGLEGTTAAAHANGSGVFGPPTAGGLLRLAPGLTTAGDLPYLSSAGAPTRLGSPSDGDYLMRWTSAVPSWVSPATALCLQLDAANILAQRNGATAQVLRGYYSYTDASNYQRWGLSTEATSVTLAAETIGTGADNIDINITPAGTGKVKIAAGSTSTDPVFQVFGVNPWLNVYNNGGTGSFGLYFNNGESFFAQAASTDALTPGSVSGDFIMRAKNGNKILFTTDGGTTTQVIMASSDVTLAVPLVNGANYHEFTERSAPSAPAANKGRVWFQDNGSGKTQMMVQFASGVAQQLAIEP